MRFYASARDAFNLHSFQIEASAMIEQIPDAVITGEIREPIYAPDEVRSIGFSRATAAQMLGYYRRRLYFKLLEESDIIILLNVIDNYMIECKSFLDDAEVATYIRKLLPFRQKVFTSYGRILRTHPHWVKQLDHQSEIEKLLLQYMRKTTDPIELILQQRQEAPIKMGEDLKPLRDRLIDQGAYVHGKEIVWDV